MGQEQPKIVHDRLSDSMSPPSSDTDIVTVARVLRTYGVHGEVRVESLSDVPDRFERLSEVILRMPTGESLQTSVTRARKMGGGYVLRFSAFSSPEEATKCQGALVQVPQESVPPLPETQYYQFELIGLEVHDENGRILGKIESVVKRPQQDLFVIGGEGEELLIPAVYPIIQHIDVQAGRITVAPLEHWDISHAM